MGFLDFFSKDKKEELDKGLQKSKKSVFDKISRAVAGKSKVDDDVLDDLEEILISSDVGVDRSTCSKRQICKHQRTKHDIARRDSQLARREQPNPANRL